MQWHYQRPQWPPAGNNFDRILIFTLKQSHSPSPLYTMCVFPFIICSIINLPLNHVLNCNLTLALQGAQRWVSGANIFIAEAVSLLYRHLMERSVMH